MILNDLKIEIAGFTEFFAILGWDVPQKSEFSPKLLEID